MQVQRECIALSPVKKQYKKSGIAVTFRFHEGWETFSITASTLLSKV